MAAVLLLFFGVAAAQQIGTAVPEVHPKLPTQICRRGAGCRTLQTSVVTDALSRSLHVVGQPAVACSVANRTQCPDAVACSQNCALEGVDYTDMGVTTFGSALTLRLFQGAGATARTLSPRVYLLADDDKNYQLLQLAGQEFTYDVDISKAGCGVNGALYMSEMAASGGRSAANPAGAQYGTGYCDAQCFNTTFINGLANLNSSGACCNEMDIWEANNAATAMTPHTCASRGPFLSRAGGQQTNASTAAVCDKSGCGINPYRAGARTFYGPGGAVDTRRPFTVVTQFFTASNGTTANSSALTEIRRLYVQDGRMVATATRTTTNGSTQAVPAQAAGLGSLTDAVCTASGARDFARLGGMAGMGGALARGMVLIFSIWDAPGDFMTWLDSGDAGPCSATQGDPKIIAANNSDATVTFSNIRWGDIGSTLRVTANGTVLVGAAAATTTTTTATISGAASTVPIATSVLVGGLALVFGYLLM